MPGKHLKYGAVGFSPKASPSRINRFVRNLPASKRASLYKVAEELKEQGLIATSGETTPAHSKSLPPHPGGRRPPTAMHGAGKGNPRTRQA